MTEYTNEIPTDSAQFMQELWEIMSGAWGQPYERYFVTAHDTSMYVFTLYDTPVHYVFRHGDYDPIYIPSTFISDIDTSNLDGDLYIGTFFTTRLYLITENGELQYSFRPAITAPVLNPPPLQDYEHIIEQPSAPETNFAPVVTSDSVTAPTISEFASDIAGEITNEHLLLGGILLGFAIVIFAVAKKITKALNAKKARGDWNKKFNEVKEDARQARIDRGWNPDKFN